MEEESILSQLKAMHHLHRRKYGKSPKFIIIDYNTKLKLLDNVWTAHFVSVVGGEVIIMGMRIALVDGDSFTLELR